MENNPWTRIFVAAGAMAIVTTGCTSQNLPQRPVSTLSYVAEADPTGTEQTHATTSEGFLLPPGYEPDDLTTTPPRVTVFDYRTTCMKSAEDLDVLRMQALVAAYNARDPEALLKVMRSEEIYDATAVPHLGSAYSDDPLVWAQAGWEVNDQLRLVMVQTYSGAGADGRMERQNDLLAQAGIGWLSYTSKVQASGCAITWFVGHRPLADECDWYTAFTDELHAAAVTDQHRASKVLIPEECGV